MMLTSVNELRLSPHDNANAFEIIPNDITNVILRWLDLLDVHAFTTASKKTLRLRKNLWFVWAKKFDYSGDIRGSHKYLKTFFSSIAENAKFFQFPKIWRVKRDVKFCKGKPTKELINGYLTSLKILAASKSSLKSFLTSQWVYRHTPLLILVKNVLGPSFTRCINTHYVKNF